MRRFLSISFIALSLAISGVDISVAHAQLDGGTFGTTPTSANNFGAPALNQPTVFDSISANQTSGNAAAAKASAEKPISFSAVGGGIDKVIGTVLNLIMSIFAWLLGVAMVTLDYSVYYTVVKMGDYVQNLSGIGVAWRILRDIGNIALIFGFLAVGITTILNVDWYGGGKKFIPSLVIAAVLLNFSLFMTEAVIDTGNLFATQFYTQINGGVPAGSKLAAGVGSSIGNEVISQKIMSVLGLQTIYGAAIKPNSQVFKEGNITFISLMGILLFIVAAFVMFSLAFILITRFIALIFVIILSPIGFAGYAIPQLASTSKKWLDTLVEQTITAPVLLLLLYIALRVITDVNFLSFGATGPNYLGFIQEANGGFNLPGLASAVLSFSVAMGLLLAVTYFSKQLGAFGGEWATKTAGKLSFGATSFALRSTAGAGLQRASRAIRTSNNRFLGGSTKTGRLLATTFDRGAKGSFDIRSTGVLKNFPGGGIDAGEAQKGGYRDSREKSVKAHQDYVKSVGEAIDEKKAKEVIGAMKIRAEAEKVVASAKTNFEASGGKDFKKKIEEQEKKVKSLEEEKQKNAESKIVGPEKEQRDRETEQKLDTARTELKTIKDGLEKVKKPLEDAQENLETKQKLEKNLGDDISEKKQAAQLAYAGNIKQSFLGGLMYGAGGSLAAHKIVKDVLKKGNKVDLDELQKYLKEGGKLEKPKEGEGGEKKPEKETAEGKVS